MNTPLKETAITQIEFSDAQVGEAKPHQQPFDEESARMFGRVFAATRAAGQSSRARLADLLIASTAAANGLPLYTRNPSDFGALRGILKVVKI